MSLKDQIHNIKIIDDHVHVLDAAYWIDAVGEIPFPPEVHGLEYPSAMTPLTRAKKLAAIYRDLYGFKHSAINAQNQGELQELYERSKSDEAAVYHKALDLAGIESALEICASNPELPPGLDKNRFKRVPYFDGFLIPLDNTELKKTSRKAELFINMAETFVRNAQKQLNCFPTSFDDYLKFMFTVMEKLLEQGCVALKMCFANFRSFNVDVVSEDEARNVFESGNVNPERYKHLQDYLLRRILVKAGEIGLPVQIHSGSTGIVSFMRETNPSYLDKLLWLPDVLPARVVLLHGGYPFCREAGFMVSTWGRRPRQLFLDLSVMWMDHPCSPYALVGMLRGWLEEGLASKLIYGSDGTSPFKLLISAMDIREALYLALKGMIDDGLIDESQALTMAELVLRGNAKAFYKL